MSVDILGTSCDQCRSMVQLALRPRKPEGSLRRIAQDGHFDSHTAPELWKSLMISVDVKYHVPVSACVDACNW